MLFTISLLVVEDSHDSINFHFLCIWLYNIEKSSHIELQILKFFSLINSCKSFNYSGLPSPIELAFNTQYIQHEIMKLKSLIK
jgi:hypothetical protein